MASATTPTSHHQRSCQDNQTMAIHLGRQIAPSALATQSNNSHSPRKTRTIATQSLSLVTHLVRRISPSALSTQLLSHVLAHLIPFEITFPCSISHPHLSHLSHSLQQWHSRNFELTILITPSPITSGACEILPTAPPSPFQSNSPTPSNSVL